MEYYAGLDVSLDTVSTAETMSASVAGQNQASSFCDQDNAERDLWKRSAQVFAALRSGRADLAGVGVDVLRVDDLLDGS